MYYCSMHQDCTAKFAIRKVELEPGSADTQHYFILHLYDVHSGGARMLSSLSPRKYSQLCVAYQNGLQPRKARRLARDSADEERTREGLPPLDAPSASVVDHAMRNAQRRLKSRSAAMYPQWTVGESVQANSTDMAARTCPA